MSEPFFTIYSPKKNSSFSKLLSFSRYFSEISGILPTQEKVGGDLSRRQPVQALFSGQWSLHQSKFLKSAARYNLQPHQLDEAYPKHRTGNHATRPTEFHRLGNNRQNQIAAVMLRLPTAKYFY